MKQSHQIKEKRFQRFKISVKIIYIYSKVIFCISLSGKNKFN